MPKLPAITTDESLALFLDFDGTLVDIVARPDLARVSPQLLDLLDNTHRYLEGALAIVSGRPLTDLDRLLAPAIFPAAGVHGIQHRDGAGRVVIRCQTPIPDPVREQTRALAEHDSRLVLEDKEYSLSLHYRLAPELGNSVRSNLGKIWAPLEPDFSIQSGKMVFELRPAGIDKGSAIEQFMSEQPFLGRHAVFIGDDITDEDAFAVVNRIDGYSAKVGRPSPDSVAQFTLNDVADVHAWLRSLTQT
jgi:trehalose 6-phosphate phosphatase